MRSSYGKYAWEIRDFDRDAFYHPLERKFYSFFLILLRARLMRWSIDRGWMVSPYNGCYYDECRWAGPWGLERAFRALSSRYFLKAK